MIDVKITEGRLVPPSGKSAVSTVLVQPDDAVALMLLGHGAGAPIHEPLMVQMAATLADRGIATFRYNYPYSERMTAYSPDEIDSLEVLLSTTNLAKSAIADLSLNLPLFLAGRSMSSQVVSLALTRERWPDVRGMVLYVFPMRWRMVLYVFPMRWRILLEDTVGHLHRLPAPMLFVQGGRDEEFCDLNELQPVLDGLGDRATLHVVQDADHDYDLPPDSNRNRSDALSEVAAVTAAWIRTQLD